MNESEYGTNLVIILNNLIQVSKELHVTLMKENKILSNPEVEKLTAVNDEKKEILQQLQHQEKLFLTLIKHQPNQLIEKSLKDSLVSLSDKCQKEILKIWDLLEKHLQDCHRQNMINGAVVNVGLNQTKRILDLFMNNTENELTYDSEGKL